MKRARQAAPTKLYPRTPRQREILLFIRDYQAGAGCSPTYEEIGTRFGISKVTVFEHIKVLEEQGLIRRNRYAARSLELAENLVLCDSDGPGVCRTCGQEIKGNANG